MEKNLSHLPYKMTHVSTEPELSEMTTELTKPQPIEIGRSRRQCRKLRKFVKRMNQLDGNYQYVGSKRACTVFYLR